MKWSYGVTAVPRRFGDALPRTLHSLAAAGFGSPRLFIDGLANSQRAVMQFNLPVSCRDVTIGTVSNWWLALVELYSREPDAERFAIFQDDLVTCANLRDYLEASPLPKDGYLNLYTNPTNHDFTQGTRGWVLSNQRGLGALGLVFSNEAVQILLASRKFTAKMHTETAQKSVDGLIVTVMKAAGWLEYVHNPSLVQHTGTVSTMGNDFRAHAASFAPSFIGEEFDARRLNHQSS